jgi:hypothetical protein
MSNVRQSKECLGCPTWLAEQVLMTNRQRLQSVAPLACVAEADQYRSGLYLEILSYNNCCQLSVPSRHNDSPKRSAIIILPCPPTAVSAWKVITRILEGACRNSSGTVQVNEVILPRAHVSASETRRVFHESDWIHG